MSGETESQVSGWSVDTLHGLMLVMFDDMKARLGEIDLRYQQRFDGQQLALKDALTSAEKAVTAALTAADRAVAKAEMASERRFESVNEFRAQLADQTATFMPRAEAGAHLKAMEDKLAEAAKAREVLVGLIGACMPREESLSSHRAATERMNVIERTLERIAGASQGRTDSWAYLVGAVGVIVAVISVVLAVAGR